MAGHCSGEESNQPEQGLLGTRTVQQRNGLLEVGGGEPQAGTGHSGDRRWNLLSTRGSLFHSLCR